MASPHKTVILDTSCPPRGYIKYGKKILEGNIFVFDDHKTAWLFKLFSKSNFEQSTKFLTLENFLPYVMLDWTNCIRSYAVVLCFVTGLPAESTAEAGRSV